MRLVDGANAILGDLPSASTKTVEIPLEAGDSRGTGISRCGSILLVRERMLEALVDAGEPVITIGGDCGVELAAIEHVLDSDVAVIWLDAHPDLHTPESSGSRAFHGMVARAILGDTVPELQPAKPLPVERLIFAGTRACDPAEDEFLRTSGVICLEVDKLSPESLVEAVEATGATTVYIHIDLDVLDPSGFTGLGFPEPFGLSGSDLVALITAVKARFPLAGAGITEFAPASVDAAVEDLPTVLRIIGALSA
jgi:arginase